ncbi:hypothetical protein LuPra_01797 [Luteitalea pratensis]|uniref:Uncharacterized protein n=1 Tax=Luteitalea pratensis TaxID=1855912 RepID=A0A143PK20_LUTPR|nr:hypothetical protein LuPra_01797 [Luteitalea pratensis]
MPNAAGDRPPEPAAQLPSPRLPPDSLMTLNGSPYQHRMVSSAATIHPASR